MRTAIEADLGVVATLLDECIAAMRREGIDQWDEIYPSRQTLESDIHAQTMHLAFGADQSLAGTLVLNEIQDPQWSAAAWTIADVPILVVHRVMVSPLHQRRGIARRLMDFAETWGRTNGYGVIRLDAFTENPRALRLYQGLGYRDVGEATFRKGRFRCFEKALADRRQ